MKLRKIKKKSKILVKAKIIAQQVLNNTEEYHSLSLEDLKIRTDYLINGLQNNKFTLDDIVVDAFSIAREIIYREYGMLAYEVQMMGAYVVHCGDFAEMYTGEGKSLTILLVAFLNALEKQGVHIVTVNEYLVERDAEFAAKAFEKLGISVGYNTSKLNKATKKEMYAKDITYTTNSELGFDYLKDNMVRSIDEKVIRNLHFVIIDEGDSVLIDEARTPLIISGQPKEDFSLYLDIDQYVSSLTEKDYKIDHESNTISLTDSGVHAAEKFFKINNLYSVESAEIVHKITNALVAHYIFANGKEYLVKDDKIYLVDQFTGRVLEGRSYNAGLQQAIQAKERVKIEPENVVMATITYQSFFRLYDKLSAVSGTAMTEAEEFLKIYNMVVVRVPTNRPIIRIDKQDYIFGSKKVKWNHVIAEIVERHKIGQPILVGTASVTDSEIIHERLTALNIPHEVLNARDNTKEAEIVKHAGEKGAITISTNMAGRGTDIKVSEEMKAIGGLYVIGTERHESRRIDNQLRGRTGRQGDPGESRFFTSLEDSLFKRFATDKFAKASQKLEDEFYDSKFFSRMLDNTQKKVEGLNFDIRKNLMDYDHVLSLQRELIYKQRDQILLKSNNFSIVNNMANDYASIFLEEFRNKENSALVDSKKIVKFMNEEILKFDFFEEKYFENQAILTSLEQFLMILKKIIQVKYNILLELSATNVIDEILLVNLDQLWTKHIDKMTKLREGVNLRSLEQRSPLNIYIEDGNNLFEKMKMDVVRSVINQICHLSLPNEQDKIREELELLTNSEEYKKKELENKNQTGQTSNINDDEFNEDKEQPIQDQDAIQNNTQSSNKQPKKNLTKKDFFVSVKDEIKEFEKEMVEAQREIVNNDFETDEIENIEHDQLERLVTHTEFKYGSDEPIELVDDKNVDVVDPEFLFDTNQEWIEAEQIINHNQKENANALKNANLIQEHEVAKSNEESNEEQTSSNDEPMYFEQTEEQPNKKVEITDEELERILNMPAFKEGEEKLSLSQYLENVLDNMNLDDDYEDIDIDKINPANINTDFAPTLAQQREMQLQEIRDEIKTVISNNSQFTNEEFEKYKQGFFRSDINRIDYQTSAKNFIEANNKEDNSTGVIKEFYKTPYVQKRKPGTLFGIPLSKFDVPLPKDATYQDYIQSKVDNAATQEQLNNLLFVDDERMRLQRIDNKFKKVSDDELLLKKLEKAIEDEPIIDEFENEQLKNENVSNQNNDSEFESDDLDYCKNKDDVESLYKEIALIDEDVNIISSALISKNDGIPYDHEIQQELYAKQLEQQPEEIEILEDENDEIIEEDNQNDENINLTQENDQILTYDDQNISVAQFDALNSDEYETIFANEDEQLIDEYIDNNFIDKFTFKKYVDNPYESEIIKDIRNKNTNVIEETEIYNINKDIIEMLEKINNSKK